MESRNRRSPPTSLLQTKQAAIKALQGAPVRRYVLHKAVSSFFAFFGVGTKFLKIK